MLNSHLFVYQENLDERQQSSASFPRALTTAVFKAAVKGKSCSNQTVNAHCSISTL